MIEGESPFAAGDYFTAQLDEAQAGSLEQSARVEITHSARHAALSLVGTRVLGSLRGDVLERQQVEAQCQRNSSTD